MLTCYCIVAYPTIPAFPEVVKAVNAKVNPNDLKTLLTTFVNKFTTRHISSSQGLASSIWLFDQVVALSNAYDRADIKTKVIKYDHGWGQVSVIFRIDPLKPVANNDLLILGAHQDTINDYGGKAAPGADDDGSGTVTIFTALKYLLSSPQWVPTRPIEFHWYSAEEYDSVKKTGLEGSKQIATAYAKAKVDDRTGWTRGGTKVISLTDDFTTRPLTQFLEDVSRQDGPINPNIHSSKDTIATLDFNHMAEFTRLAVAFVVELSQAKTKLPVIVDVVEPDVEPDVIDIDVLTTFGDGHVIVD
ncbi:hypothetical protein DYB25_002135 [Aphanomyces astaci]|uniref:Peptidase M28 domain-containing protein n=1 Tax=Aphanomyces astaci TaxID=112090 RepID=A0A397A005_APHAT|nr:hypothetical protein DYB25_002135 [Aphanomyces astaci]